MTVPTGLILTTKEAESTEAQSNNWLQGQGNKDQAGGNHARFRGVCQ